MKNRTFEESHCSIEERNDSEARFFRSSNFKVLPSDSYGIDALRTRLSNLLFDHIKRELPSLRQDLDTALAETEANLAKLGTSRASVAECRTYLTTLNLECLETTKAAADGHYESAYFQEYSDAAFDLDSPTSVRRFRAAIQLVNRQFAEGMRVNGPKYNISGRTASRIWSPAKELQAAPTKLSHDEAIEWIMRVLTRSRGKEPVGNYNPLIIGELYWELSSKWKGFAEDHVDQVSGLCSMFMDTLLEDICPKDIRTRLAELKIKETLQSRKKDAIAELDRILRDKQDFPAVYNHYYTDNVQKARNRRMENALKNSMEAATSHDHLPGCNSNHTSTSVDLAVAIDHFQSKVDRDMERYSCEEALDCLLSMYKVGCGLDLLHLPYLIFSQVQQKTFVANVTAQVVERHLVRGLDRTFSPLDVTRLSDEDVLKVASEPASVKRQRGFLLDRKQKLRTGKEIFRDIMGRIK